MSKKLLKILALALSAVLLVGATIAGTVAYLTSTAQVSNTFTFGNVSITMDEVKVDEYGKALTGDAAGRIPANAQDQSKNIYKLIPGHEYIKDTQIHVAKGSESCYLFVKIDSTFASYTDVEDVLETNGWTLLTGANNADNVYCYASGGSNIVTVSAEQGTDILVINKFVANPNATTFTGFNAVIIAYAVQSDGFDSAAKAWNATFGAGASAES